jgi:hypothetical protein
MDVRSQGGAGAMLLVLGLAVAVVICCHQLWRLHRLPSMVGENA